MIDGEDKKIWRYMELGKFLYLLQTQCLYFTKYCNFEDPLEGMLPRKYIEALRPIIEKQIPYDLIEQLKRIRLTERQADTLDLIIKEIMACASVKIKQLNQKFGVSCWKVSDTECAAMWKLVPKDSIAIVSSTVNLKKSLPSDIGVIYNKVRYRNFELDEIDQGHEHYSLFIKDSPFEFENEFRAALLLKNNSDNENVKCDLNQLISQIYISPHAGKYLYDCVLSLCNTNSNIENPQIVQSQILACTDRHLYEIPIFDAERLVNPRFAGENSR